MERLITDDTIQYFGKFAQLQMKLNLDDATEFAIETANTILSLGKVVKIENLTTGFDSLKFWSKNGLEGTQDPKGRYYKIGMLILGYNNIVLTFVKRYKKKEDYAMAILEVHMSNEPVEYSKNN